MKKILAITTLLIIAIASINATLVFAQTTNSATALPTATPPLQILRNWVHVDGKVTNYGTEPSNGSVTVQALATRVITPTATAADFLAVRAFASAIWNITTSMKNGVFTRSFNSAQLVYKQRVALNYEGKNFYLNGTWNVYKVTIKCIIAPTAVAPTDTANVALTPTSTRQVSFTVEPVVLGAKGQFNVTGSWTKFVLAIDSLDAISGYVTRVIIRNVEINRFKVTDDAANTVTVEDIRTVVKSYGACAGAANYDQSVDFNLRYKIDITNLATVAANLGK
jgi:hypothetical protein